MSSLVSAVPIRLVAGLFAAHLAVMGVGAVLYQDGRVSAGVFDLDAEGLRWFVVFSAVVLLAGAALAVVVRSGPALVFGAFLVFMAVDDAFQVHETLERNLSVDGPTLYSPVMAGAAVAALVMLRRHRDVSSFVPTLVAGGTCWAAAVLLEKLQWSGDVRSEHYSLMMIPEELLEATGSFLFAVALVLVVRSLQGRSEWDAWNAAAADADRAVVGDHAELRPQGAHVSAEVGQRG